VWEIYKHGSLEGAGSVITYDVAASSTRPSRPSRSEAPPSRAVARSRAEKLPLHFLILRAPTFSLKGKGNFSARQCRLAARRRSGANWIFSGIFGKMSSSFVVNILHHKTRRIFESHFVGGRNGRPLNFRRRIKAARRPDGRLAVGQNEVRLPCDFEILSRFLVFALP